MRFCLTLLLIPITPYLTACDCIMTPITAQIKETNYIVTGRVIALLDNDLEKAEHHETNPLQSYRVKLKINDNLKGNLKNDEIIELSSEFSNCDIYFTKNETWRLFYRIIFSLQEHHLDFRSNNLILLKYTNIIPVI